MENIVNFEHARTLDLIKTFKEEKKKDKTDAVSALRNDAQKYARSITNLEGLKSLVRMTWAIQQVYPQYYEIDYANLIPTIAEKISVSPRDVKEQVRKFGLEYSSELGFIKDSTSEEEIAMLQERYVRYCAENTTEYIDLYGSLPKVHTSQFLTTWSRHKVYEGGETLTTGEYVIERSLIKQISKFVCNPSKPFPIYPDPNERDFYHYNGFKGWPYDEPIDNPQEHIKLWLQHTYEVIASSSQQRFNDLLNYWAHCRQHPEITPEIAIVLYSDEGTGKDAWIQGIRSIFHPAHVGPVTGTTFQNIKWTTWAQDKIFVFITELSTIKREEVMNHLKGLITNKEVEISKKGKDVTNTEANYLRIVISTNSLEVLPLHEKSRRFALFQVSEKYMGHLKYFDALFTEIQSPMFGKALSRFLLDRNIGNWQPRQMNLNTPELLGMSKAARNAIDILKEFILEGYIPSPSHIGTPIILDRDKETIVNHSLMEDVYEVTINRLRKERHPNPGPSTYNFASALMKALKLGVHEYKYIKQNGENLKRFKFPPLKELRARHGLPPDL